MRSRIVLGLMLVNAVYSSANVLPLAALQSGLESCGQLVLSYDTIRLGRALWFGGKYGLVSFELFIIGASILVLKNAVTVMPRRIEFAAQVFHDTTGCWFRLRTHVMCWIVALLAGVSFYVLCYGIDVHGYNRSVQMMAIINSYHHISDTDDLDDDPQQRAMSEFATSRDE